MKLAIGNDHAAVELKNIVMAHLEERGIELVNVGTDTTESFDYPISGYRVGKLVASGEVDGGVLICGTGVGISLAANKVEGVRACVCSEPYSAALSKRHNNTNVICFGARVVGDEMAKLIVDSWLDATYEGGRHDRRVAMLNEIDRTGSLAVADA
ncbi:MAG: ribose 5-phosphate isomerase B [Atopobiaceae bacterium]|nr:ribose 5-phosphate isomerase B [Atopobiaceae bacterium]